MSLFQKPENKETNNHEDWEYQLVEKAFQENLEVLKSKEKTIALVMLYLDEMEHNLKLLRKSIEYKDDQLIRQIAHKLRNGGWWGADSVLLDLESFLGDYTNMDVRGQYNAMAHIDQSLKRYNKLVHLYVGRLTE